MPNDQVSLLTRNLAALSRSHAGLSALIERSTPSPVFSFPKARDGSTVPALQSGSRHRPLHSLVDPRREAARLLESIGDPGYLVCFGLGGGFHAQAFLQRQEAAGLLIVEKDASTLRSLMGSLDLSSVLADPRTRVTVDPAEIPAIVRSTYLPAIAGDLSSLPLRPWCRAQEEFFERAARGLSWAAEEVRADYAVQAHFGKRWFSNMIMNLPAAQETSAPPVRGRLAHVTAAGPTLEADIPELAGTGRESIVIATDTSLPALLRAGVRPHIVVSIDCQLHSYHHFLPGVPAATVQFFDLASPPFLVRQAGARCRFFTSAHPFSRFAGAAWRRFPMVDTTGGNVTHAAVSLARAMGIRDVRLHGADFSYPDGKPYARGTYLYDWFHGRQQRTLPLESSFASFVLGSPGLVKDRVAGGIRFSTGTLRDYKARLEKLMEATPADEAGPFEDAPARSTWKEFLARYAEQTRALPVPSAPLGRYFSGLRPEQRALWATLLPITARVLREGPDGADRARCLEESRQWALQRVNRVLAIGWL